MISTQRHPAILRLIIASLCVVLAGQFGLPIGLLRVPAGIVVALFAPGYAGLMIVRPRHLAETTRLTLSIPSSLAMVIIAGTILDVTPLGVRPGPMTIIVVGLTMVMLIAAWWRGRADETRREGIRAHSRLSEVRRIDAAASTVVLAGIITVGMWVGNGIVRASHEVPMPFTEFYQNGVAIAVSKNDTQATATLHLRVDNHENRTMMYTVHGLAISTRHRTELAYSRTFAVRADTSWEGYYQARIGCGDYLEAHLWVDGRPYRSIRIRPLCAVAA